MEGFQGKLVIARGNPSTTITSSFYCRRFTETLKFANLPTPSVSVFFVSQMLQQYSLAPPLHAVVLQC